MLLDTYNAAHPEVAERLGSEVVPVLYGNYPTAIDQRFRLHMMT
jgi:hypothetical protein